MTYHTFDCRKEEIIYIYQDNKEKEIQSMCSKDTDGNVLTEIRNLIGRMQEYSKKLMSKEN